METLGIIILGIIAVGLFLALVVYIAFVVIMYRAKKKMEKFATTELQEILKIKIKEKFGGLK